MKYNEQLLLTLEEDEFSCKQRLAYKLEQVRHLGFSLYGLVFSAASAITRIPVASLRCYDDPKIRLLQVRK